METHRYSYSPNGVFCGGSAAITHYSEFGYPKILTRMGRPTRTIQNGLRVDDPQAVLLFLRDPYSTAIVVPPVDFQNTFIWKIVSGILSPCRILQQKKVQLFRVSYKP
jgi:hypothetical protein